MRVFLYAYIRSMAKDRLRALNHIKLARDRARAYMARVYGAVGTLSSRYRADSRLKRGSFTNLLSKEKFY